jgi:hypothetical protein
MAITKMSIGVPPVNRFTVAARALSKCGRTPAMNAGWMEKVMTTMHNSDSLEVRELKDELSEKELKNVFGGKASFNDFNFTHHVDKASPVLMMA